MYLCQVTFSESNFTTALRTESDKTTEKSLNVKLEMS